MGFSRIDTSLTFDDDLQNAVLLTEENDRIVLDGQMMFAGCFGHFESKSWFFLCHANGREDYVLERQNCDVGEGWFLYRWTYKRPDHFSSFDDAVHKAMCSHNTEWNAKYMTKCRAVHPVSIDPNDNPVCRNIQELIEKGHLEVGRTYNEYISKHRTEWIE